MVTLVNRAKMTTATTGTGTITLGTAESGYQSFADAGVVDADVVRYVIEDGNNWEIGTGTYTASGTTLSRTVSESSNADAALNLTGSAVVYVSATAEDIPAAYTNTDVDTHLNTGTASSGEVLSWTGTDYDWIAAGGGGGPVRLARASIGGFSQIPPIDLGYFHSSTLNFNTNQTLFVPWVAPIDGTVDGISLYFAANNVTTSQEVALGVYSDSAGMPDTRLSFGIFDPNGLGLGWKSIAGLSQPVTQNTLYWLAASTNAVSAQIQCRCYRRNGFMPRPVTSNVNDDQSLLTSGQQVSSMTVVPYVGSTTNEPFLIVATYL